MTKVSLIGASMAMIAQEMLKGLWMSSRRNMEMGSPGQAVYGCGKAAPIWKASIATPNLIGSVKERPRTH
jgi:hypothetical protein